MRRFELSGVGRIHLIEPPTGDGPGSRHPHGPDPGVHSVAPRAVRSVDHGAHPTKERIVEIFQKPQGRHSSHQHNEERPADYQPPPVIRNRPGTGASTKGTQRWRESNPAAPRRGDEEPQPRTAAVTADHPQRSGDQWQQEKPCPAVNIPLIRTVADGGLFAPGEPEPPSQTGSGQAGGQQSIGVGIVPQPRGSVRLPVAIDVEQGPMPQADHREPNAADPECWPETAR